MSALAEQGWLSSAAGGNVREFYAEIGIDVPATSGIEAPVRCFTNQVAHKRDDRNPSCSVNVLSGLWCCHGCGQSGNAFNAAVLLGFSERRARELAQQFGLFLEAVKDDPPPRLPTERQLVKWRKDLQGSEMLLSRLWAVKGWTPKAVVRCGLGWDGKRIVFTIRDRRLKRVGVVRYHPRPPAGERKCLALPGSKRLLFPPPEVLSRKKPLFLVEGEADAVSIRSLGLQATAVPGTGSWRLEFAQRLGGFRIVVLSDADAPGRDLARRVSGMLPQARVVDLEPDRTDGVDVGDWVRAAAHDGGLGQVRRMLERLAA